MGSGVSNNISDGSLTVFRKGFNVPMEILK